MLHRSWNVFLNVLEAPNVDKELVDKERLSAVCPCHCVAICVAWARRVHPDCGGSADDGGRLPGMLWRHQGVSLHAGIGEDSHYIHYPRPFHHNLSTTLRRHTLVTFLTLLGVTT